MLYNIYVNINILKYNIKYKYIKYMLHYILYINIIYPYYIYLSNIIPTL